MTHILGTQKRCFKTWNTWDKILLFILILFTCGFFYLLFGSIQDFSFSRLAQYFIYFDENNTLKCGILLNGLFMTIRLSFWCLLIAFISGGIVGTVSAHKKGLSALPSKIYILSLRNMPPLILLFLVFFFSSNLLTELLINLEYYIAKLDSFWKQSFYIFIAPEGQLDRMFAAVITLGLYEGAYIAEIIRAGIESVSQGQWEAGKATGMTKWKIRRYIVAPQAMKQSIAPLAGQSISAIKDSAIASIISLQELTFQSIELMNVTGKTIEIWVVTAICYFCLAFLLETLGKKYENSIQWKHHN